jgi:hypothetical protein
MFSSRGSQGDQFILQIEKPKTKGIEFNKNIHN